MLTACKNRKRKQQDITDFFNAKRPRQELPNRVSPEDADMDSDVEISESQERIITPQQIDDQQILISETECEPARDEIQTSENLPPWGKFIPKKPMFAHLAKNWSTVASQSTPDLSRQYLDALIEQFNNDTDEESDSSPDIIESSQPPHLQAPTTHNEEANDSIDIIESSQPSHLQASTTQDFIESSQPQHLQARVENNVSNIEATNNENPLQCPQCKANFTPSTNVHKHMSRLCPVTKKAMATIEISDDSNESHEYSDVEILKIHPCPKCDRNFSRKNNMQRHLQHSCPVVLRERQAQDVRLRRGQINPLLENDVFISRSSLSNHLTNYQIMNTNNATNAQDFLEEKRERIKSILHNELVTKKCIKFNLTLETVLQAGDGDVNDWGIKTDSVALFFSSPKDEIITELYNKLLHKLEEDVIQKSGWTIITIENIILKSTKYEPLAGSSYIPLPKWIDNKRAVINPQNKTDNQCFKWSILSSFHKGDDSDIVANLRQYERCMNFEGLVYPVPIDDIKIFERNNVGVSVSVYALDEDDKIYPVRYAPPKEKHFDLLVLEGSDFMHYTYIEHFEALFYQQLSRSRVKKFICKRCLTHHYSEYSLIQHMAHCEKNPLARVIMPKSRLVKTGDGEKFWKKPTVKFEHSQKSIPVPVAIYADSEAVLKDIEGPTSNDPAISSTTKKQQHVPFSFGYVVNSSLPSSELIGIPLEPVIIRKENPTKEFLNQLIDISVKLKDTYSKNTKMIDLTTEEQKRQSNAQTCYLCDKPFTIDDGSVRDHCHITGKYRGPAHNSCNLLARNPKFLPVFLHNLCGYDSHFLIRELGEVDAEITIIPNTTENVISFSITPKNGLEIRFIDSFRFMSSSLDSLAKNLTDEKLVNVRRHFAGYNLDLLKRKGVFCYDYVNDFEKLNQTHLPPRKDFHSKLYEANISKKEYRHAQKMWSEFKCKNLGEYSDLYLKLDVLLLADVFQAFRDVCTEAYNLDPAWYYTAPGLAWDAALRFTKVELDLIQNEDMFFMFERGIRGGVAQCCKRYAKANNPYLGGDMKNQEYIAYLDANNLYGWAMSQKLPTHDFRFENVTTNSNVQAGNISKLDPNGDRGYIFEVDVAYDNNLHHIHKDLPFLPENMTPPGGKYPKLLTTLYNKKKYVVHYRALQQAIKHGLRVTKVHRVVSFFQSNWLAPYINLNTLRRQNSKTAFEKDFFKLMNNAVYGKTMENVRHRICLKIVNDVNKLRKLVRNPFFKDRVIYNENLCAVHLHRKRVIMNKPIYVGMSILDLSKVLMYDFHYEKMLPLYRNAISLLYMDTDSFVYHIKGSDFYKDMSRHLEHYDTSDYPPNHFCHSNSNKKVLGKFKDEANSVPVRSFVGLRAKMYAMKYGDKVLKRAKGVKRYALAKKISYNDYVRCLKENSTQHTSFRMIRSNQHNIYTVEMNKVSLAAHDDKRFIMPNNIDTLPHGHFQIPQIIRNSRQYPEFVPNMDFIEMDIDEEPHVSASSDEEIDTDVDL
jgi:uncharacterized C2H2 Zn-finger protein